MNHPLEEILIDFILDELDENETKSVREHIEECEQCRKRVQELMATLSVLDEYKEVEPSGAVQKNVIERIELEEIPQLSVIPFEELQLRARKRRPMLSAMAAAAIVIFAFYLGQVYFPKAFTHRIELLNARLEVPSVVAPESKIPVRFAAWNEAAETSDEAPKKNMPVDFLLKKPDGDTVTLSGNQSTDEKGSYFKELSLAEHESGIYEVIAMSKGRKIVSSPIEVKKAYDMEIFLNRPIYRPSESIQARVTVRQTGGPAAKDEEVTFILRDPLDSLVTHKVGKLDEYGVATFSYMFADIVPLGQYSLKAIVGTDEIERKIIVNDYSLPTFKISLDSEKPYLTAAKDFNGIVKAEYFFGEPIVQALTEIEYYYVHSGALVRVFNKKGHTDSQGTYKFTMHPSDVKGIGFENDDVIESYFKITVEDSAHRREEIIKAYPFARDEIVVKAFPDGGRIRPLVNNIIYISVSDPMGIPFPCQLEIDIDGKKSKAQTSDLGVYSFEYKPEKLSVDLTVSVEISTKRKVEKSFKLSIDEETYAFAVRSLKGIYQYGEDLSLDLLIPFESDIGVRLDFYKGAHWLSGRDIAIKESSTRIKHPLQGAYGEITVEASLVRDHMVYGRDRTAIIVLPPDELSIDVSTDKKVYSAGEKINASLKVKSDDELRKASVGVVVADKSIIEAGEKAEMSSKLISESIIAGLEEQTISAKETVQSGNVDELVRSNLSEYEYKKKDFKPKSALAYLIDPEVVAKHRSELMTSRHRWEIFLAFLLAVILYVSVIASIVLAIFNLRRGASYRLPLGYNSMISMKVFAVWGSLATLCFALTIVTQIKILFIVGVLFSLGFFVSLGGCMRRIEIVIDNGAIYHVLASTGITISALLLSHLWMVFPFLEGLRNANPLLNPTFISVLTSIGALMIVAILLIPLKRGEAEN